MYRRQESSNEDLNNRKSCDLMNLKLRSAGSEFER